MMRDNSIYRTDEGEMEVRSFYDSILNMWPVQYETIHITARYADTHVIICGDRKLPPLILLHGASSNATMWCDDIVSLSRQYRVYAVDLPGEAGKSSQQRISWRGLGYAEWLHDVLKALQISKTSMVGISHGGWAALRFATYYPEYVDKLVLLTPAGIVPVKKSFIRRAILYSLFGKSGAQKMNRLILGSQHVGKHIHKFMDLIMTHFKPRMEREYIFTDYELLKLKMQVLLIGGEKDVVHSVKQIDERMNKFVPQLRSVIMADAGHVLIHQSEKIITFLNT